MRASTVRGGTAGNALAVVAFVGVGVLLFKLQPGPMDWVASPSRWLAACALLLAWLIPSAWIMQRGRGAASRTGPDWRGTLLVAYASQTGQARVLAKQTAESLRGRGVNVEVRPLEQVTALHLLKVQRALFVCSTTGEGDAPDHAQRFVRDVLSQSLRLQRLHYSVLALGDRQYRAFCGFGHGLDAWLRRRGAQPLFELVEVDNGDETAVRQWQRQLARISGDGALAAWTPAGYGRWQLHERRLLNPGSQGAPVFALALQAPPCTPGRWGAGDIAEVRPRHPRPDIDALLGEAGLAANLEVVTPDGATTLAEALSDVHLPDASALRGRDPQEIVDSAIALPHREYSIASTQEEGVLRLVVRQATRDDGSPGLASSWLCRHAALGSHVDLRIRSNPNFHAPESWRPMILIGSGTGVAGLRAHIVDRIARGARRNWLLFGERERTCDFFHGDELSELYRRGDLERLDLAFSRDQPKRIYVQHVLSAASCTLRQWIDEGASIHVCGSLQGMAPGVDLVLREVLGDRCVEDLIDAGRYRRDVY